VALKLFKCVGRPAVMQRDFNAKFRQTFF
jgi:hypothetical protein